MVRGEGCWLWDADGHRLLDALGEFTAGLYGHSAAPIRQAIVAALDGGLSLSSHTLREVELAREIVQRFPSMALLRFTNSGTEANLLALAAAVAHTGRRKVLVFEGAYHGGVLAFGGATALGERAARVAARALQRRSTRWRRSFSAKALRWPRSWSSRCSVRAVASPAPQSSCTACAGWPTTAARC